MNKNLLLYCLTATDKGIVMTETSHPAPNDGAALEQYGMRGVSGISTIAQIAPLSERYVQLCTLLRSDEGLRGLKWLRNDMQFQILTELLGTELSADRNQARADIIAAYQRPFSAWLQTFEQKYHWYVPEAVKEQLANAWHDVEELLIDNPR